MGRLLSSSRSYGLRGLSGLGRASDLNGLRRACGLSGARLGSSAACRLRRTSRRLSYLRRARLRRACCRLRGAGCLLLRSGLLRSHLRLHLLRLGLCPLGLGLRLLGLRLLGLRLSRSCRACLLRLYVRCCAHAGATGAVTMSRRIATPHEHLHFGHFAALELEGVNYAARAAVDDDHPHQQQNDGDGQNDQAYDDQRVRGCEKLCHVHCLSTGLP